MKKEIIICLGSSCFSRGNKQTVQLIKDYLKEHQLEDQVFFHGNHCTGNCADGPIVIVDGKTYQNVSPDNAIYLLDKLFKNE